MYIFDDNQPAIKRIGIGIFFIILLTGTLQCSNPTISVVGTLQLRLTSQSVPQEHVRSVFLTISSVSARSEGALSFEFSNTAPRIFDLFELQNGITRILDLLTLPDNRYDAIRLTISDVNIELTNGRQFITVFPDSHIVEINLTPLNPITVRSERLSDAVIDFDLLRSLQAEGDISHVNNITGYHFDPKARIVDLTTAGQITGLVKHDNSTPSFISDDVSLKNYPITVVQPGQEDSVSVFSSQEGEYTMFFVPAGSYTMLVSPTDSTLAWSVDDVVVTTANLTRQDVTTLRQ